MTLLPIVDRELRVTARRRATYWTRFLAAGLGIGVGGAYLLLANVSRGGLGGTPGVVLLGIYGWLAFLFALASGVFLTSDSLSQEKREGTLGLLFLTDLRGHDVVLGKLASCSLTAAYGLLAVFPIFGFSMLLGGVTGAQFWKLMLVLANTLFFSLAAGLFVSSLQREATRAMNLTVLLVALVTLGFPAIDLLIAGFQETRFVPRFSVGSPGAAFVDAITNSTTTYWASVAITHVLGWVALGLACRFAPRRWQDAGPDAANRPDRLGRRRWFSSQPTAKRATLRAACLDANPARWLVVRDPLAGRTARLAVFGIAALIIGIGFMFPVGHEMPAAALMWLLGEILLLWGAMAAARFWVEARRNGALELLLVTPLPPADLVRGMWWGLRRFFLLPVAVFLAVEVIVSAIGMASQYAVGMGATNLPDGYLIMMVLSPLLGVVRFVAAFAAILWFGMWMGLTSVTMRAAIIKAFVFVEVLPAMVLWFVQMLLFLVLAMSGMPMWLPGVIHAGLAVALCVAFIGLARRKLGHRLRELAANPDAATRRLETAAAAAANTGTGAPPPIAPPPLPAIPA